MAYVISGDVSLRTGRDDLTVLLLNSDETKALNDLLEYASSIDYKEKKDGREPVWSELDELMNGMFELLPTIGENDE